MYCLQGHNSLRLLLHSIKKTTLFMPRRATIIYIPKRRLASNSIPALIVNELHNYTGANCTANAAAGRYARVRVFLCQKKSAPSIQKQALARLLFSFLSHHAGAGMLRLRDALHRIVKYLFCRV
jgi:hypothetical protein